MNEYLTDLSPVEDAICVTQADLFEFVADKKVDMEWFISVYMNSDFCKREMDSTYSHFQMEHPLEILDFLLKEIGNLQESKKGFFHLDVASWLGYIYRQVVIQTGLSSKEVFSIIPLNKMCNYYAGLHTVSDEMATDIICENFNLKKIIRNKEN